MRLFHRKPLIEVDPTELRPTSLVEDIKGRFSRTLDELRGKEIALDTEIADREERRGHVRIAIASFEAAHRVAVSGGAIDKPILADADTATVGRLVPRTVKGGGS